MIKYYTKFLQALAKRYIARHQPLVVWVTGSAGKSSAVTAIGTVLTQLLPDQQVYFPSKQLNGELGLPLTIFQVEYFWPTIKYLLTTTYKVIRQYLSQIKPYDIIVLEYGVDHIWEMDMLLDITIPDYAIVTNIDTVHFWDIDLTRQEKSKLIKTARKYSYIPLEVVETRFNLDLKELQTGVKSFAIRNKQADINVLSYEYLMDNPTKAGIAGDVSIINDVLEIITNSIEQYYLIYTAIWYSIALELWAESIKQLPVYFELPASRASMFEWINHSVIIDSSYNSSPVGTLHLLDTVQEIRQQYPDYNIMCLMGEMRELYDLTESAHRELAQRLIDMNIDYIWLVWESTSAHMLDSLIDVYDEYHVFFDPSSIRVGQRAAQTIASEDKKYIILVKWSQNSIFMEEAIKQLLINPNDASQLCRQSDRRMVKKRYWFNHL